LSNSDRIGTPLKIGQVGGKVYYIIDLQVDINVVKNKYYISAGATGAGLKKSLTL
jgi:hypothetical protein